MISALARKIKLIFFSLASLDNKKTLITLLLIMAVGIFLRTYHYADLMRFGKDQARDASIMRSIVVDGQPIPLLGPKAGGTDFLMGPIFYYFQYASAKLFGFSPITIALPDLFFSLATIPLLFFFLKKYFKENLSLALTGLYAVSFFAVQNGRFAWNPNSLMFFSLLLLYALLELASQHQKRKNMWAVIAGVALGVGVQLHTLYILVVLSVFLVTAVFLIMKRQLSWKQLTFSLLVMFCLNIPQVISEIKTKGGNTQAFLTGIGQKSFTTDTFPVKMLVDMAWQAQAGMLFVFPIGDDTSLHAPRALSKLEEHKVLITGIRDHGADLLRGVIGMLLFLFGWLLLLLRMRKEQDTEKKFFLGLIAFYFSVAFIVFIPLSHVLELRYFLILEFLPFVLLGLIVKFLQGRMGRWGVAISLAVLAVLLLVNFWVVFEKYKLFSSGNGDLGIAIWGEEKFFGDYILSHMGNADKVLMVFEPDSAHKFVRSLSYFHNTIGKVILGPGESKLMKPEPDSRTAYFTLILNEKRDRKEFESTLKKSGFYDVTDTASYGRLIIYSLASR